MSGDDTYIYRPPVQAFQDHVKRYPRHYGALALFAVAMLLVPAVGGDGAPQLAGTSRDEPSTGPVAAGPSSSPTSSAGASTTAAPGPVDIGRSASSDGAVGTSTGGTAVPAIPGAPPSAADASGPEDPVPAPSDGEDDEAATPGGVDLPPPPAIPLPPVPAELEPLVAAVAPLTTQGCSSIGLAGVVVAVAAPAAGDQVPVAELMPYLAPAYSACATFPPPSDDPTVCELDEAARDAGYPQDVSGLMKTPNIIGIGIDTLYGIEAAVEAYTGQSPGLVGQLAEQLGCH